jgi:hypothetical protein
MKEIYNITPERLKQADLIDDNAPVPNGWTDKKPLWILSEKFENGKWVEDAFSKIKAEKTSLILNGFTNDLQKGHFMSPALGIEVDCRRDSLKNDLQNVQGLISYATRKNKDTVDYVGYSEIKKGVNKTKLLELSYEMEDYVMALYQKKWAVETILNSAATIEELEQIIW